MAKDYQRLNRALEARRVELDMRWGDLAARARIAVQTLGAIRAGRNAPSVLTARRLEDVLGWQHGSIDAILDGRDPEPLPEPTAELAELADVVTFMRSMRDAATNAEDRAYAEEWLTILESAMDRKMRATLAEIAATLHRHS